MKPASTRNRKLMSVVACAMLLASSGAFAAEVCINPGTGQWCPMAMYIPPGSFCTCVYPNFSFNGVATIS